MPNLIAYDWAAVLLASAEEVLETMFFCSILGSTTGPVPVESITAKLRFDGIPSGTLTIVLSRSAVREMSSTFLGIEANLATENQFDQVVGELANVICGNTLSRVALGKTFNLTHPEIIRGSHPSPVDASTGIGLEIENGFFAAFFNFDSE